MTPTDLILTVLVSLALLLPPLVVMWRVLKRIGNAAPQPPHGPDAKATGPRTLMDMGN